MNAAIAGPDEVTPGPPRSADVELIADLRADLIDARFTNDGVAELLGADAVAALEREQIVPGQLRILEHFAAAAGVNRPTPADQNARRPVPDPKLALAPRAGSTITAQMAAEHTDPCAVVTGLWLLAVDVTVAQINAALPRTGTSGLEALGLVRIEESDQGRYCRPAVDLRPYQVTRATGETAQEAADLWVTSDLSAHQVEGPLPHEHVLGIGHASLTLAGATHRRHVGTALDLGTGCGIQLLHLLDHCDYVIGTDLSQRALEFAQFNLLINAEALNLDPEQLDQRVELRHGSLLEPVAEMGFDLVVSNPPFVITPRSESEDAQDRYVYRDGGREGDTLMAELITTLPRVLNEGGVVQMLGNWEIPAEAEWSSRPREWAEDSGLSAWFIQRDQQTPAQYAETWLRDASEERDVGEYRRRYADYLADFEARSVVGVGFGLITLQRPRGNGQVHTRFEELTGEIQQPIGPVIGTSLQRQQQIAHDSTALLDQVLVVPDTVTEERYQRFGAEHPEVIIARQGTGLRRARPISSAAAGFLAAADGDFAAGQLITAVCALTDSDEDDLTQEVLDLYSEDFISDLSYI